MSEEKMVKKIERLLATARDEAASEEEAQTALLKAQKLMAKYNIDEGRFSEPEEFQGSSIEVTDYKTLMWWEKRLANLVAKNFRTKAYFESHISGGVWRIIFWGDVKDLEIAAEVYTASRESFNDFTKRYYKNYYNEHPELQRSHATTREMKKSYALGFLEGLKLRFEENVAQMLQEFGVMVIDDEELDSNYKEFQKETNMRTVKADSVNIKDGQSYERGIRDGKSVAVGQKNIAEAK